jgi:hypothetical protein
MDMPSYIAQLTDKEVLKTLKDFERERTPLLASASEIAARVGCTPRTVLNSVVRLEKTNRIRVIHENGKVPQYEIVSAEMA